MVHGLSKSKGVCGGGGQDEGGTKPKILTKGEKRANGNQGAEQTVQRVKTHVFTGK